MQTLVIRTFPSPIDRWALSTAESAIKRGRKKMMLPVDKVHAILKEFSHNNRIDEQISLFITAILEYIAADIFKVKIFNPHYWFDY